MPVSSGNTLTNTSKILYQFSRCPFILWSWSLKWTITHSKQWTCHLPRRDSKSMYLCQEPTTASLEKTKIWGLMLSDQSGQQWKIYF
jgi:hypothetical protein